MSKKTYNGILKDNTKEQNYIHPQTNSRQVLTGENNNSNLQEELNAINDKFAQIQENETNKGAFRDYNSLIAKYQNSIANPLDRAGWTAIVEDEDKIYFYDTEENQWKPTATGSVGVEVVNGISGKNITLTGSDIKSTIDSNVEKTITQHLQDIKNITSDTNNDIVGLENSLNQIKTIKINGKTLEQDINLKAVDIQTESGASVQSHIADLDLKYNDQESAIEELENELNPLLNKTNVLYLNNDQMFEAVNAIVDPYSNNQVVVATDDGDYKKGSVYKFNISGTEETPIYEWEEITSSGGNGGGGTVITDTLTLSKEVFVPEVPAKKGVVITGKVEPDSINENYPNFGFRLAEDGWYESTNAFQQGVNTFSLCKIYFNVEEETNVIFDVYNNGEQSYDFGYLSKLDTELEASPEYFNLDVNSGNIYYDFYSSGDMQTEVVYENVPVGEHFISVKYVKDSGGDAGIDKIRFKLSDKSKGSEAIPSYTYKSSNSIKIGDHNNLQIEDKDILKFGDTIKKLVGTEENPIKFCDLEEGLYIIKGNIVWDVNKKKKGRVFSRIYDYGDVDAECLIQISKNTEKKYLITTYSAQLENFDLLLTDYEIMSGSIIGRFQYEYENDQLYQAQYDLQQYAHQSTLDYQVNTLNSKIDNVKIINSVSNPLEKTTLNDVNKFFVSNDPNKKELYYTKITKIDETKTQLQPETQKVYNASIDKNIVNQTLSTTETSTVTLFSFDILTEEYGMDMNWQWVNAEIGEGKIKRLTLSWSGISFYTEEDGWTTSGNSNDDNYFNVTAFINEAHYPNNKIYLNIHNIEASFLPNANDFLFDVTKNYTITPLTVEGIKTLTSPVRIWDLEDGVYKLPTNCAIQYNGETNTASFNLGSSISGILTVSSSKITTIQSPNTYEKNIFWEISYGDNQYVTSKIIGRTTSRIGYYNKLYTGRLTGTITTAMAVPMCNDQQTMSTSSNFWLMGTAEQYSFNNVQHSSSCYIKSNEIYSNYKKVATEESLNTIAEKVIYVNVSGYDGDENDISFRIPATVGLVQTYYYDNADYGGEIKVRIIAMSGNNATITTISKPSGVEIITTGSYVKLKDL